MSVTFYNSGRRGNILFVTATTLAYCKKYDLDYYIPVNADAYMGYTGNVKNPVIIPSTGAKPVNPRLYREPNTKNGMPYYHEIPKMDNVLLEGYYQSFLYFDWCRDYIINTFNFPYTENAGVTAIHTRFGDCIGSRAFPIAPFEYYQNAINYMKSKGFNKFLCFSDHPTWNKEHLNSTNFPDCEFEYFQGNEDESWIAMHNCSNQITARSTFSLTSAWFNRNPNKIVLVPTLKHRYWNSQNHNLLTGTPFIEIDFKETQLY